MSDFTEVKNDIFSAGFTWQHKTDAYAQSTSLHFHEPFEIYFCVSGGAKFIIESEVYTIEDGSLFVINDLEIHKTIAAQGATYERMLILIDPDYLRETFPSYASEIIVFFRHRKKGKSNKVCLSPDEQTTFRRLFTSIGKLSGDEIGYHIRRDLCFIELILFVMNIFQYAGDSDNAKALHPQVLAILQHINENFALDFSLSDLANQLFMNRNYMCTLFKREVGTTIVAHLLAKRLAHAKYLLRNGASVSEAGINCGFNNYAHFIRTFTKQFGLSPLRYKKMMF